MMKCLYDFFFFFPILLLLFLLEFMGLYHLWCWLLIDLPSVTFFFLLNFLPTLIRNWLVNFSIPIIILLSCMWFISHIMVHYVGSRLKWFFCHFHVLVVMYIYYLASKTIQVWVSIIWWQSPFMYYYPIPALRSCKY